MLVWSNHFPNIEMSQSDVYFYFLNLYYSDCSSVSWLYILNECNPAAPKIIINSSAQWYIEIHFKFSTTEFYDTWTYIVILKIVTLSMQHIIKSWLCLQFEVSYRYHYIFWLSWILDRFLAANLNAPAVKPNFDGC